MHGPAVAAGCKPAAQEVRAQAADAVGAQTRRGMKKEDLAGRWRARRAGEEAEDARASERLMSSRGEEPGEGRHLPGRQEERLVAESVRTGASALSTATSPASGEACGPRAARASAGVGACV